MELNVRDRLILLSILPQEGDFTTLKIVRQLREDLSFSEDDHKLLKFVQADNQIAWNPEGDHIKKVEFKPKSSEIVANALKELDKQKKLKEEHIDLYEKFVKE